MRLVNVNSRFAVKLINGEYTKTMKQHIIINYIPQGEYDLVSKEYVDKITDSLDLMKVVGYLPKTLFPPVTGDFTKIDEEYMLTNKPFKGGTYPTVIVGANGITKQVGDKIPGNAFPKMPPTILSDNSKPKTLKEMGIKDMVSLKGDGYTNAGFRYEEGGTRPDAPVTQEKADIFFSPLVEYEIGDIILVESGGVSDRNDFLQADGEWVSKEEYPKLYDLIGDDEGAVYSRYHGKPWAFSIDGDTDNVRDFKSSEFLYDDVTNRLGAFGLIVTNNKVYIFGGYRGVHKSLLDDVYVADVNDGIIGKFRPVGKMPGRRAWMSAIILSNRVYLVGGTTDVGKTTGEDLWYNDLDSNGNLTSWKIFKTGLKYPQLTPQVYISGNRLCIMGGFKFSVSGASYTPVNSSVFSWSILKNNVPVMWNQSIDSSYTNMSHEMGTFGGGYMIYSNEPSAAGLCVGEKYLYSNNIGNEVNNIGWTSLYNDQTSSVTSSKRISVIGEYDFDNLTTRGTGHIIIYNNIGSRHRWIGSAKFGISKYWSSLNGSSRYGEHTTFIESPHNRDWCEAFLLKNHLYIVGGISGDLSQSGTPAVQPTIRIKLPTIGQDDYRNKFKSIEINPTMFKLPTINPVIIDNKPYLYYIKSR